MRGRILGLVALLLPLGAGCLDAAGEPGASGFTWETEGSMAPDFTGAGPSYPVLLVHFHVTMSEREREEYERNPVVCIVGGPEVPALPALPDTEAEAPCMPPPWDQATGRVFMDQAGFSERTPVMIVGGGCDGSLRLLEAGRSYEVGLPGHTFLVDAHTNGTFSVDGRHIAPGTSVKATYWIDGGDPQDEKSVRAVFDAPGRWLLSRVGEGGGLLEDDPDVPPRPDRGTGLVAEVPEGAGGLVDVLDPLLAATPGRDPRVLEARIVLGGGRLTEVLVDVSTHNASVRWYGAGRIDGHVRVLGAQGTPASGGVASDALLAAFAEPLTSFAGGDEGTLDLRLARERSVAGPTGTWIETRLQPPTACDGTCLHVLVDGAWRRATAGHEADAEDARSLAAEVLGADGSSRKHLWHVPE